MAERASLRAGMWAEAARRVAGDVETFRAGSRPPKQIPALKQV